MSEQLLESRLQRSFHNLNGSIPVSVQLPISGIQD